MAYSIQECETNNLMASHCGNSFLPNGGIKQE
jgi:hypothetical protein